MSLIDVVARVVAGPASRVVEAPVRDVVDEVLREQPLASTEDLLNLGRELERISGQLQNLESRLTVLVNAVDELQQPTDAEDPARRAEAAARQVLDAASADLIKAAVSAAEEAARAIIAEMAPTPAPAAAPAAAPAEEAAAPAEAPAAPAPKGCKVEDCQRAYRARGFCGLHYQTWRRGTLGGYVSPEGLIYHGEQVLQVGDSHIAAPFSITGRGKKLKVKIDGKAVDYTLKEG